MKSIKLSDTEPFIDALKAFFEELKVTVDYLADEPVSSDRILGERYTPKDEAYQLLRRLVLYLRRECLILWYHIMPIEDNFPPL